MTKKEWLILNTKAAQDLRQAEILLQYAPTEEARESALIVFFDAKRNMEKAESLYGKWK